MPIVVIVMPAPMVVVIDAPTGGQGRGEDGGGNQRKDDSSY